MKRVAIIGTGPAGVSALRVLVSNGIDVTVFDGGFQPSEDALEEKSKVLRSIRSDELVRIPTGDRYSTSSTPLKKYFGSLFAYQGHPLFPVKFSDSVGMSPSFSSGGLSNVWGASSIPFRRDDTVQWPTSVRNLDEDYNEVLSWLPTSGANATLAARFPALVGRQDFKVDNLVGRIIDRLSVVSKRQRGVIAGRSSLAIKPRPDDCHKCGSCLSGCPFDYIYSARIDLLDLIKQYPENIEVKSGCVVTALREQNFVVEVRYARESDDDVETQWFDYVFLAAGPVQSTALVLTAQQRTGPVSLRDCQAFTVPLISLRSSEYVSEQISLAHGIIELVSPDRKTSAYFQIYPSNREIREAFVEVASKVPGGGRFLAKFAAHALAAHGFLGSRESGSLSLSVQLGPEGDIATVSVSGIPAYRTKWRVFRALGRIVVPLLKAGVVVVLPAIHREQIGRSYHIGASFPITDADVPDPDSSDYLGRPGGLHRISVVDASTLPELPPQSPTLTVMANSHRITRQVLVDLLDKNVVA